MSTLASSELAAIDWTAPWLFPYVAMGQGAAERVASGVPNAEALNAVAPTPTPAVRFVPQSALPAGEAYESYIFRSGCCPTREGLHDFFNGLAWLQFPHTKRRLNQLHVAQIAQTGIQPVRGPARDCKPPMRCGTRWPPKTGSVCLWICARCGHRPIWYFSVTP